MSSSDDQPRTSDVLGGVETAAYRTLLNNDRFRNLFWAMLTSSLGDWIGLFAILSLTTSLLGTTRAGAFAISGVMIARIVPTLVLGPVAGVFVDRWDRRRTLILTDIVRGVVMVLLAFAGDVFQLIVATLVIEIMSALFIPAKDATLPNLVEREHLVRANQLSLMVTYGTLPIGSLAFALLVGAANTFAGGFEFVAERPAAVPIWINALTFFVSAFFITRIAFPGELRPVERTESPGAWQELKEGLRFIASKPLIRALVGGVMAAFLSAGVVVGVGEFFATILNAGDSGFGVLGFAVGAGLFAGLVAAGPASGRMSKERLFAPGIGIAGGALVVAAFMPRLDIATAPAFVMGFGAGMAFVTGYTMLQEHSGDEIRGRTFAAFNTGVRAALFASLILGPVLVGLIGVERSEQAIERGAEQEVEDLDPDGDVTYPYQVGGVRITLAIAGLMAIAGAVYTGRSIHQVLSRREDLGFAAERVDDPRDHPGLFVVFEGGEGAGKSTQIRLLRGEVERAGCEAVVTREPGGTTIGERVRELLLDTASREMGDRTEALLYAAARSQLADEVIRPALERGAVVLCDRYIDSSVVYQGIARGLGDVEIEELNRWGTGDLAPDLIVLLDIAAEEGLRRAGDEPDRLESAGLDFHRSVNAAYRRRAATEPIRYLVLDAERPAEELHHEICEAVLARLPAAGTEPTEVLETDEGDS